MHEHDVATPIPVLLVGHGASGILPTLTEGLGGAGEPTLRFACVAFEDAAAAAASVGATHLVLVALGDEADGILADPVWATWQRPGNGMARIALSDAVPSADVTLEPVPETHRGAPSVYRLPTAQADALPMAVVVLARLLEAERIKESLRAELETERACEPLTVCLEPGKIFSMTLDLLLEQLGVGRGIALFASAAAARGSGLAARGFDDEVREALARLLLEDKSLDTTTEEGEVSVIPWSPLHPVLAEVGVEAPGPLLSVPLRGEAREAGHLWLLSDGRRFSVRDLVTARTVARRANAALATAERYHDAKERAFIDDVTGVYNARYLLMTVDHEIQRAERYGNPLSVLFLDLDRFKLVNDRHGHLIGSETLRVLAKLLRDCVRQVDTLARYGGDEFTILLVDTPHEAALRVAERIRSRVERHLFEAGREGGLQLTISIGVATCPDHGETRELLLDAADKAMYRAKSEGRNRIASANDLTG